MSNPVLIFGGLGGLFWGLAYILVIRRSFMERTFGIPFAAMCANISWEFTFSFLYPPQNTAQWLINLLWFILDIIIIYTYLRFGRPDFTSLLPKVLFYLTFVMMVGIAFVLIYTSVPEFNDLVGKYSAFTIDFMMSMLFVIMLLQRGSTRGQSFYIAMLKLVGSAFYSIVFYTFDPDAYFLIALYILTLVFNTIYAYMMFNFIKAEGENPLRRF